MEAMTPFDVVAFLFLIGWFLVGYFQGITRRVFGIITLVFSLLIAAQLRAEVGGYLAAEWQGAPSEYGYMVGFGAVFLALWVAISIGIQWFYRPSPLLNRYPALDELIGGLLGVLEGLILLIVLLLVTDPYFLSETAKNAAAGEFGPLRWLHDLLNDSLTASFLRHQIIPNIFAVVGWLFPQDVTDMFRSAIAHRLSLA